VWIVQKICPYVKLYPKETFKISKLLK
jgi:hypothetical protein